MSTYDGRKPEPPYPTPDDIESLRDDIESLRDDIESLRDDIESLRDDIESLREAAKLSEARGRACEAADKRICGHDTSCSMGTCAKCDCGYDEYVYAKAALAAAEKGIE